MNFGCPLVSGFGFKTRIQSTHVLTDHSYPLTNTLGNIPTPLFLFLISMLSQDPESCDRFSETSIDRKM